MKTYISFIFIFLLSSSLFAQKDSKYTNYYYDFAFGEQFGVKLLAKNVVSKTDHAKLALEINNETDDYILFYKDKCKFVISENSYYPETVKKGKILEPKKSSSYTVTVKGQTNYLVDNFNFKPGGIFTFSSQGKIIETEEFHLPANRNQINSELFTIKMLKLKKETDETAVKFECTYLGNKIAIVSPSNCVIRTENGKEWANARSDMKPFILQKNESEKFTIIFTIPGRITDMQFAEMDIDWKNTFSESELKELFFDIQTTEIDKTTTSEKN